MILLVFLFSMWITFTGYFSWKWRQGRHMRKASEVGGSSDAPVKENPKGARSLRSLSPQKRNGLFSALFAFAGAGSCVTLFHQTPVFGLVFGGLTPYLISMALQSQRNKQYREDEKAALKFGAAIFSAGGTIEEWIKEVVPRLHGPLHDDFALAAHQSAKYQISVTEFLGKMSQDSPDPFFRWAMAGIYSNATQSGGDLPKFISEVIDELQTQERFERIMKGEQKKTNALLMAMIGFPVALYFLFQSTVEEMLAKYWTSHLVLLIGMLGYIGLFSMAARMTRPKIFNE
jgi:Flp pilus assembly protein TadB